MNDTKKIMVVGEFCGDVFEWQFGVPLKDDGTVDGTLQDVIDIANADYLAEEWQEYFLDQEREFPR